VVIGEVRQCSSVRAASAGTHRDLIFGSLFAHLECIPRFEQIELTQSDLFATVSSQKEEGESDATRSIVPPTVLFGMHRRSMALAGGTCGPYSMRFFQHTTEFEDVHAFKLDVV
jgi:hypothetical protein